ncbi:MAG: single-stranded-DNA-specific exonuclease RecJ, partial [Gammaproteobacteria bacterium]|nr:single-stranded-DNA-specific exonuclease RecJ [Gammaproteobacteria bacterium]
AKNIKVLITDHHLAADELPAADAIVNPNQPGDEFRSKHLAGVGVIFYILLAFRSYLREQDWFATQGITEPNMADYLDLVALGTVADVAVLDKNNRILVEQGLKRIRAGHCRPGIKALFAVANRELKTVTASDLGFVAGPRLNAAGRLEDMSLGIECLMTTNEQSAREMTEQLQNLNHERRAIEDEMRDQAFKILDKLKFDTTALPAGVCLFDSTWHQGVIGILASRIKDKYHRPTIAFAAISATEIKGSARSIEGLHIRDALDAIAKKHPELIAKFGGHAMAAGLSIARKDFEAFQKAFAEQAAASLPPAALQQKVLTDGELTLTEMTLELAQLLKFAMPWGQGFPEPLFEGTFDILDQRLVGQKHLKLVLKYDDKQFQAIAFNVDLKQWPNYRKQTLRAVYRLDVNNFNDYLSLQLLIEHIIN